MKYKQTQTRIESGLDGMRGAFSHARAFCSTADELHAAMNRVLDRMGEAPRHAREYVKGFGRAEMDSLYRDSLVFGGFIGDSFYSTHRDRADYYETRGVAPSEFADNGKVKRRGHYWRKDTSKPFFIGKESES